MRNCFGLMTLIAIAVLVPTASADAQVITGVVRDASGGVLPGVTCEVSSPALIEKARTLVTDGVGQYRAVNLRPGIYTATFTLPGFTTVQREGIEVTGDGVFTVNVDLRVGELAET